MGTYDTIGGTPISPPDDEVCEWCEEGRCTASEKDVPHCSSNKDCPDCGNRDCDEITCPCWREEMAGDPGAR